MSTTKIRGDRDIQDGTIIDAQIAAAAAIAYSKLDLAGAIIDADVVSIAWSKITDTPITLAGYGITDPIVLTDGSYADPAWITSLAYAKLTGAPVLGTSAALDVGTVAGTVAAGDHLHTGVYEPVIGTLGAARGGTGFGVFAIGDLLYADGAASLAKLADVAAGAILVSGGVGAAPSWSATPSLTSVTLTTPLAVASGGTGAGAFTAGSIVFAGAAGVYTQDNAGVHWDAANKLFGLGTATPTDKITIHASDPGITLFNTGAPANKRLFQILGSTASGVLEFNVALDDGSGVQTYAQFDPFQVQSTTLFSLFGNSYFGGGVTIAGGQQYYNPAAATGFKRWQIQGQTTGTWDFQRATDDGTASETFLRVFRNGSGSAVTFVSVLGTAGFSIGTPAPTVGFALQVVGALTQFQINETSSPGFRLSPVDGVGMRFVLSRVGAPTTNEVLRIADLNAIDFVIFNGHTRRVGLGSNNAAPESLLHLAAGSATANTAPLQFTSGPLESAARAGVVEFLTDDFFATITTGAARKAFVLDDGARLTAGKIPVAGTNGRLVDGQTPLAGTKVYYVSDASGGAVTRKLTFTNGILVAEV